MPGIFQEQQGGQRTPRAEKLQGQQVSGEEHTRKRSGEGRQAGVVGASGFYAKCSEKPLEGWQPVAVRGL